MEKKHIISKIIPGGIGEELDLEVGDEVLEINGQKVNDVFDYRYLLNEEFVVVTIKKQDGEIWELEVEKEYEEDLGIEFENGLMDNYRTCCNNCIFCFIDQMPKGMRDTLYFKDDDSRLSFLQGNYVTLTNMSQSDIDRIIKFHLAPINVSIHTMNPKLRVKMLHNRFAGEALKKIDRLYEGGITMNGQIVLCKGVNDGKELAFSIKEMSKYAPVLQSVSVVPVGTTKYRDGLFPMKPFTKEDAIEVIDMIEACQKEMYEKYGIHFIHASDEWYILAGRELPKSDRYDGYLQIENGVGMLRSLLDEVALELKNQAGDKREIKATIATGVLAAPFIKKCTDMVQKKYPNVNINVVTIINNFFGKNITVSGLITGTDLSDQLKELDLGQRLLLPCSMIRDGSDVFLDDMTIGQLEKKLNTKITLIDSSGKDLVDVILNPDLERENKRRQKYEQTDSSNSR